MLAALPDWALPTPLSSISIGHGLSLSPLHGGDKTALVLHLRDTEIAQAMLHIPQPYTLADAHNWVALARARARGYGRELVLAIRDEVGFLVGCAGFEIESSGSHKAELGYWLAKPYWGRGWMTEVVKSLVAVAWQQHGWSRLSANVFEQNTASARVLQKAGFTHEATLRKFYYKAGVYSDAKVFAITR